MMVDVFWSNSISSEYLNELGDEYSVKCKWITTWYEQCRSSLSCPTSQKIRKSLLNVR